MKAKSSMKHLSVLGVWALAFGCAVGSDAFVMPWTTFLPTAGPLGTMLGLVIGGLVISVVAWNYHCMINRYPGPGGVYAYASAEFGRDHGFVCGWFLGLTYMAIVWLDATAFASIMQYLLGGHVHFGFNYMVNGSSVCLGETLYSLAAVAVAAAICCRRRLSGRVQTVMAVVFAAGILACFAAAVLRYEGGLEAFSGVCPRRDTPVLADRQVRRACGMAFRRV